jgi:flagellar basal body rod protein FlgC
MSTTRRIAVIAYNLANAKTPNKHNKTDCDHDLVTFTHKVSKPYLPSK